MTVIVVMALTFELSPCAITVLNFTRIISVKSTA